VFLADILTYSMSQMTDSIRTTDIATQTLLPKPYNDDITKIRYLDSNDDVNTIIDSPAVMQGLKLNPTLGSWHFEDDIIEMEAEQHFIPYCIEPFKPWNSFIPFPFRLSGNTLIGRQKINWYALLQSIDDLIRESNLLVDKLEGIIQDRNEQSQYVLKSLNEITKIEPTTFIFPSEHWLPIIEKQEMELNTLINSK